MNKQFIYVKMFYSDFYITFAQHLDNVESLIENKILILTKWNGLKVFSRYTLPCRL